MVSVAQINCGDGCLAAEPVPTTSLFLFLFFSLAFCPLSKLPEDGIQLKKTSITQVDLEKKAFVQIAQILNPTYQQCCKLITESIINFSSSGNGVKFESDVSNALVHMLNEVLVQTCSAWPVIKRIGTDFFVCLRFSTGITAGYMIK